MSNKKCETCMLYNQERQGCVYWQHRVEKEDDCCHWTDELLICSMCGRPYIEPAFVLQEEEDWFEVCGNCAHSLGTCATCKHSTFCAFREDASIQQPLTIPHQIRQGNAVIMTQIKNPERVRLTCEKCACYSCGALEEECGCNREEFQTCGKYQMKGLKHNG